MIKGSPYQVDGQELQVGQYSDQTPSYTNRVLIKSLNPDTTKDCLFNYLKAEVRDVPADITYGATSDTAMVTFRGNLGIQLYVFLARAK